METFEEFCAGIVVVYIFVCGIEMLSCCIGALAMLILRDCGKWPKDDEDDSEITE